MAHLFQTSLHPDADPNGLSDTNNSTAATHSPSPAPPPALAAPAASGASTALFSINTTAELPQPNPNDNFEALLNDLLQSTPPSLPAALSSSTQQHPSQSLLYDASAINQTSDLAGASPSALQNLPVASQQRLHTLQQHLQEMSPQQHLPTSSFFPPGPSMVATSNILNPKPAELSIPTQYSLPTPRSSSAGTSAANSASNSARNSFSNQPRPVFNHDVSAGVNLFANQQFVTSAVEDDFAVDDGQLLMPNISRHYRSSSIHSDMSSVLNSPAFAASSPLVTGDRSPFLDALDTNGITGLETALAADFSINDPILNSNTHFEQPVYTGQTTQQPVIYVQQPQHTDAPQYNSNSPSIVTTPEITIDAVDELSVYSGSPAYTPGFYSDVETFPALESTLSSSLYPPTETRRRSHSDSALDGIPSEYTSPSHGFYQHHVGSNASLASVGSSASYLNGLQSQQDFLSPDSAQASQSLSPSDAPSVHVRRKRAPRSYSHSSGEAPFSRDSLSPGRGMSRSRSRDRGDDEDSGGGSSGVIDSGGITKGSRPVSGSRSRSRSATREHILEMASPSPNARQRMTRQHPAHHTCSMCDKTFTRAYNLRSHLRTHTNERPFKCKLCGKAFARQHDCKRHEELHSGEKRYECSGVLADGTTRWGCGHKFARADALGRHFRTEVGRQCIRPLVEEADREKAEKLLQQVQTPGQHDAQDAFGSLPIYNGNGHVPALTLSPPSNDQGATIQPPILASNDDAANNVPAAPVRSAPGVDLFPQALLQQYPALANYRFD